MAVGGLGFGEEDVAEKIAAGYRILHTGSTTGSATGAFKPWPEGFDDR